MARKDKLLEKLASPQASMTWDELVTVMRQHGFELMNAKRGSGRRFYHREQKLFVRLHEPHPSNIIKPYVRTYAIDALKQIGVEI